MEYQNKLSRLRHAFLKLQGQDLTQVLLRAAAGRAEGIAKNVYSTEEIFRTITDKIYEATNELSLAMKFELASDAASLALLKKELIEDTVRDFEWEETLFVLLENVNETDKVLMKSVLNNQRNYLENCTRSGSVSTNEDIYSLSGTMGRIVIPMVRKIYDNFPIKNLVGIQPMSGPVGLVYTLQYKFEEKDDETDDKVLSEMGALNLEGSAGRRLTLEVIKGTVEAGSRKLKAGWSLEDTQDLNSWRGLDLEPEMTQMLSAEVSSEFTYEVISDLKKLAGEPEVVKLTGDKSDQLLALGCRIRANCSGIAMDTRRGAGNFIVVSLTTATALKESKHSCFKSTGDSKFSTSEMIEVGTMSDTIRVFTADVPDDEILIGYKGSSDTDTGYVHCPYVPLMSGGVVVNEKTFQPVVRLVTRYGKYVTKNAETYYRNIKVESDLLITKKDK